jgi:hypothetical protein
MLLLSELFKFVIKTSAFYKIDESHALKHSMDVYHFGNQILNEEIKNNPILQNNKIIIDTCCVLHDMCDKKYMNEKEGLNNINNFLSDKIAESKINVINDIISTMSYSKVQKNGFPDLKEYNEVYHIVRQADILSAYDIDRAIMYAMIVDNKNYKDALDDSIELFNNRVLLHIYDDSFYHKSALEIGKKLHKDALFKINLLKKYNNLL